MNDAVKFQVQNILHKLNLSILVGLIIALPFAVDRNLMFPTQSAKYFLFSGVLLAIIIIALLQLVLNNIRSCSITKLDIALVIYFLYVCVRVIWDIDQFGISQRFWELVGLGALYIILRNFNSEILRIILIAVLIAGTTQAIYGNLQLYGIFPSHHGMYYITGGFFNPGPYAGFLAIVFPIALVLYLYSNDGNDKQICMISLGSSNKKRKSLSEFFNKLKINNPEILKYVSLLTIITILLVLPATRSRAAWLAVITSSVLILAGKYRVMTFIQSKFNTVIKKVAFISISFILLGVVFSGLYIMKKGSADGRLLIWKGTVNMIVDKPLLGFGYDRFKANYLNYQADYFEAHLDTTEVSVAGNSSRAFNEYLQVFAEGGVIGLLLLLFVLYIAFFGKQVKMNGYGVYMKMSLIAFGIFALFSYPMEFIPIKLCGLVGLALVASGQRSWQIPLPDTPTTKIIQNLFAIGIFAGMVFLYGSLRQQYADHKQWKIAYQTYQMGAYEDSVVEYGKVYDALQFNGDYLVNYGKACSMAGKHKKAINLLERAELFFPNTIVYTALGDSYKALKAYSNAEMAYNTASLMLPDRLYPKYLLAKLYDESQQEEKAILVAKQVFHQQEKVASMAVEEMKVEMEEIINKQKMSSN